jgi:hypothetical protein
MLAETSTPVASNPSRLRKRVERPAPQPKSSASRPGHVPRDDFRQIAESEPVGSWELERRVRIGTLCIVWIVFVQLKSDFRLNSLHAHSTLPISIGNTDQFLQRDSESAIESDRYVGGSNLQYAISTLNLTRHWRMSRSGSPAPRQHPGSSARILGTHRIRSAGAATAVTARTRGTAGAPQDSRGGARRPPDTRRATNI